MEPTTSQTHPVETSAEAAETLSQVDDDAGDEEQAEGQARVPAEEPRRLSILEMLEDDAAEADGSEDAAADGAASSTDAGKQRRSFRNPETLKGLQEANRRRSGDGAEAGAAGSGDAGSGVPGSGEAEAEEVEAADAGTLETAETETGEATVEEAETTGTENADAEAGASETTDAGAGAAGTTETEAGATETAEAEADEVETPKQETAGSATEAAGAQQEPIADRSDEDGPAAVEAASPEDGGHPVVDESAQAVVDDLLPEWIGPTEAQQEKGLLARLLDGLLGWGRGSGESPGVPAPEGDTDAELDAELMEPAPAGDEVDPDSSPTEDPVAAAPEAAVTEPEARNPDPPAAGTGDDEHAESGDDGPLTVDVGSDDPPAATEEKVAGADDTPAGTEEKVAGSDDPARAVLRRMIQERDRELVGARRDSARLYELAATVDDFVDEVLAAARE